MLNLVISKYCFRIGTTPSWPKRDSRRDVSGSSNSPVTTIRANISSLLTVINLCLQIDGTESHSRKDDKKHQQHEVLPTLKVSVVDPGRVQSRRGLNSEDDNICYNKQQYDRLRPAAYD